MTALFQSNLRTANEDLQPTPILDEPRHEVPALPTGSSTSPTLEYWDSTETQGPIPTATDTTDASPVAVNVESGETAGETESVEDTQPNEGGRPQEALQPPPDVESEAVALYPQMKRIIARRTRLPDSVSALVAFWIISTWFQDLFSVLPCLLITGPPHEAMVILRVLHELCCAPILLAGFKRGNLKDLSRYRTLLISEQNLDARTAALLGNLTNRGFALIEQGSYLYCATSKAVYIGEDPATKRIQHFISIDATVPARAADPVPGQPALETIDAVRNRILEYRTRNLDKVRPLEFNPSGLSLEATVIANALGSCILEAPQLQTELVALLKPADQQRIADRFDGVEALVVGAALALCHQDKGEVFVKEIAAEVNRLLAARGETRHLSPEKVGHMLKKVGMLTRRLSQAGNGLTLDQATRIHLHEVAAAYRGEDSVQEDENLHCPLCEKNQLLRELM
jgi:hypothetical protein